MAHFEEVVLQLDLKKRLMTRDNMLPFLQVRLGIKFNIHKPKDLKTGGSDRSAFEMKMINILHNV